jgi:hypothetical protein
MKFNFSLLILLAFVLLNGCSSGPEAEKAKADWIANADSIAKADSFAKVNELRAAQGLPPIAGSPKEAGDVTLNTAIPQNRQIIKSGEIRFRTNNVRTVTEKIEDIVIKAGGYIASSELTNNIRNESRKSLTANKSLVSKEIIVENSMLVRIPKEKFDTFLRAINPLIEFLDYRKYQADDQTYHYNKSTAQTERVENYAKRQTQHIDKTPAKLKESTEAEDKLLDRQLQSDALKAEKAELEDRINFSNIRIDIYQKAVVVRDVYEDFNNYGSYKPNIFLRIGDSIVTGWEIFEDLIVFLFKIWGILVCVLLLILIYRFYKRGNRLNNKNSEQ